MRAFEIWRDVDMTTVGYYFFHDVESWIISEESGGPFLMIGSIFSVFGVVFLDYVLECAHSAPVRDVTFQLFDAYAEAIGVHPGYSFRLRAGELHCESLEYGF